MGNPFLPTLNVCMLGCKLEPIQTSKQLMENGHMHVNKMFGKMPLRQIPSAWSCSKAPGLLSPRRMN